MESNVNKLEVNFFEYCIIEEKTYLPAETVKVRIPKLTTNINKGTVKPDKTILINDNECKPVTAGSIKLSDTMIVKTFSGLELSKSAVLKKEECGCKFIPCHSDVCHCQFIKDCKGDNNTFIDGYIVEAYLPAGAQMIVCFMDNNINDGYLTNLL